MFPVYIELVRVISDEEFHRLGNLCSLYVDFVNEASEQNIEKFCFCTASLHT